MGLKDRTRRPTGAVPWPLLLIEGPEKTGKTTAAVFLSASAKTGRMYWIDFGEGSADEYGAFPGVDYEIVTHDGSWADIYQAVTDVYEEAKRAAEAGEKPVVLLLDGMNAEWDLHKNWASARARSTKANRGALERDPNAEVKIPQNCWNDANARHRQLMWMLMRFPGIAVMTSRGKVVSAVDDHGRPIEGKKDYRVEGQKDLGYDATAWIRLYRDQPAIIVGARSVHMGIRAGKDDPYRLGRDWTLEEVVFDLLKCDPATARVRDFVELVPDMTPEEVLAEARKPETTFARVRELWVIVNRAFPGVTMSGEGESEERLLDTLTRLGTQKRAAEGQQRQAGRPAAEAGQQPAAPAAAAEAGPARADLESLGDWGEAIAAITGPEDAEVLEADADKSEQDGSLDQVKAAAIRKAIKAKVTELAAAADKAA